MKEFIKKNFILLLAFLLPILLIAIVALSAYVPSLFISTNYNFIYTACTDGNNYYRYSCDTYLQKRYVVVDSKLVVNAVDITQDLNKDGVPDFKEGYTDRIFLHDTKNNQSREITLDEAKTLTLNNLLTSPDGVTVSGKYNRNGGSDFFIFGGGSSSYNYYLVKGNSSSKINLINSTDRYYYQNNFQFVGWVLPGRN